MAQESCQAGCLHNAPFTYLPTSPYSLLYNAKSTRVMCQIISSALFSFPLPIPFFQMANRSRRCPTVQLKDKLKALLSLVKVAPVQQRKKQRERARERGSLTQNPAICMNQEALWFTSKSIKVHLITHSLTGFPSLFSCGRHFLTAIKHQTSLWSSTVSWYMVSMCVSDMKCHDERTSHLRVSVTQHSDLYWEPHSPSVCVSTVKICTVVTLRIFFYLIWLTEWLLSV